ncbi:MAG: hypothetical protein WAN93_07135, partial [Solirubrobacteraceae bacterium]
MKITVRVLPGAASNEENQLTVTGGGAAPATISRAVRISEEPAPYGVEDYEFHAENEGGSLDTQAGSHPYQVTGSFVFNQGPDNESASSSTGGPEPIAEPKDVIGKLPAGLLGNPRPFPTCSLGTFLSSTPSLEENACPPQTAVGVASVVINDPGALGRINFVEAIYNLEPYAGEPARYGFSVAIAGVYVILDVSVRSGPGEDYGVNVTSSNITQTVGLDSVQLVFWGVPGDPVHDDVRGEQCILDEIAGYSDPCAHTETAHPPSLLTMPTSCNGPLQSSLETDSWTKRGVFVHAPTIEPLQALDGCNRLPFSPSVSAEPTTDRASAPSGLDFNLDFKDEGLTSAEGLAQSQLKDVNVALPAGLTINPSA